MAQRIRAMDWSATPLGPIDRWSPTLRATVRLMLANRFPHLLWWGPELIQLYNDAYIPVPGTKHPKALGQAGRECWPEIWHIIGPLVETPFNGGPATWMDDILLEIHRHGFLEETHFTIAYSPVPDEAAPRGIGGVLATIHETTQQVIQERRLAALGELGARSAEAKTAEEACGVVAEVLEPPCQGRPLRAGLPRRGGRARRPASRVPRASSPARHRRRSRCPSKGMASADGPSARPSAASGWRSWRISPRASRPSRRDRGRTRRARRWSSPSRRTCRTASPASSSSA